MTYLRHIIISNTHAVRVTVDAVVKTTGHLPDVNPRTAIIAGIYGKHVSNVHLV